MRESSGARSRARRPTGRRRRSTRPVAVVRAPGGEPAVERDLRQAVPRPDASPGSSVAPVKLGDERVGGSATSSAGVPSWRMRPSLITPTRSASVAASSKSCVTRIVGRRRSSSSSRSSARTPARVCVSSAESGSSSSRTAGSRASARASATRWRSPPESSRDARAARGGRSGTARAARCAVRAVAGAEADVAEHVEVREERVLLEEVADAPVLRRRRRSALRVEQHAVRRASRGRSAAGAGRRRRAARSSCRRPTARRARASRPARRSARLTRRSSEEGE